MARRLTLKRWRVLAPLATRTYESGAGGRYCSVGSFGKFLFGVWVKREGTKLKIELDW